MLTLFICCTICSLIGYAIGIFVGVRLKSKTIGNLRVDTSDPDDGPYLFLELNKDMDYIFTNKQVILDVKMENYVSQK